jgi:hypothetical protein
MAWRKGKRGKSGLAASRFDLPHADNQRAQVATLGKIRKAS